MKRTLAIVAILAGLTAAGRSADVTIDIGSITIPSAAVSDGLLWLATDNLYSNQVTVIVLPDPETGEPYTNTVSEQVVIPETPVQKIRRIAQAAVKREVRHGVLSIRQARAQAEADAAVDALPDPVDD